MTHWKHATFYTFGWIMKVVAFLWLDTCRIAEFGREIEERYLKENPGKGLLYASWHRGLFFVIYWYRNQNIVSIASASEDGELAAQAAKRFGWLTVRGSSSSGGRRAFREMEALVKKGYRGGLVADAPTGPRFVSKPGIIYMAKRTGLPIIPVIWGADRYWTLKSWDRTIIPKPFARIVALYADKSILVPPDASRQECEQYRKQLDNMLNRIMYQADHFFKTPDTTDPRRIEVPNPLPLP
ncbi:MAG: lysophospholipid acyltransferase family protein [Deltaproteobacteria bacterium]|nr:lysophospholipid acyltransferase family protein [Deltaproteobacteria bacterium]MBW1960079.1 lysophospholipid acyltransferase family protein [Deltaproteobacteria bacterium]MBW2152664.1 lysophospholipid acyltransferase family protein [Deltaproteobacteria bacterium]